MELEKVWEPGRIGTCEIRNRIVRTSHATNYNAGGPINEDFIAYHERAARGGVGLSLLEIGGVHPTSPGSFNIWDDSVIPGWQQLMARMRPLGMKVFQQLWHGGSQAFTYTAGPLWSASALQPTSGGGIPRAMTVAQIDEVVDSYARAAKRCVEGGLDGIEVQIGHGYLLHQFLSPLANRRTDQYGGDLSGRMRFSLEVLAAVREAVGGEIPVGVRCSTDEAPGGFGLEELVEVLRVIQERGHADHISIATGSYFRFEKILGGMYEPPGYQLVTSGPVAATVSVPTIVTGRMGTLEEAEQVLRDGIADFVALTRAHIADPLLVLKTREGRKSEVRPCIACDACLAGSYRGRLLCTVNPAIGREAVSGDHHLVTNSAAGHVVVVGAGPSGLEAARAAAIRGLKVTVLEVNPHTGGQLAVGRLAPRRERLGVFADWQLSETTRLGVDIRTSTEATVESIAALSPDAVIVAAGSRPRLDGVQSPRPGQPMAFLEGVRPFSSWEVLSSSRPFTARTAVVIDDTGHYEGIAVAERLVSDGVSVNYATWHSAFATLVEPTFEIAPALGRLRTKKATFDVHMRCLGVTARPGVVELGWLDGGPNFTVPAELVVFVSPNRPMDTLLADLADTGIEVIGVGDALSPRYLRAAVIEGHDAGAQVLVNAPIHAGV